MEDHLSIRRGRVSLVQIYMAIPYSHPYLVAVDRNHMVWFSMKNTDRIAPLVAWQLRVPTTMRHASPILLFSLVPFGSNALLS